MKNFYLILFSVIYAGSTYGQIQDIADRVLALQGETTITADQKRELDTLWNALKLYRKFEQEETKLNGRVRFGFTGNESDLENISKIRAGIGIDNGVYPYELDLKTNLQTLIQDGVVVENISDIDISFDYHPRMGNGLFLETFVFLKRFNNSYLSIDYRFDAGCGIVLNLYSSNKLLPTGNMNVDRLSTLPAYKIANGNLWKCFDEVCRGLGANTISLSPMEVSYIDDVRYNFDKTNIKKYAKLRLALLLGIYYENEKAKLERELLLNNVETLFFSDFNATHKLRWEVRPTLVYKPSEIFIIRFYPYIKFPMQQWYDVVAFDSNISDRRADIFYDIQASISAKITKNISIGLQYRYFRDLAPKRVYHVNTDGQPFLVVGQETNSFYNLEFMFGF